MPNLSIDPISLKRLKYFTLDLTLSVDPRATNIQDLLSNEYLSDFLIYKNDCHYLVVFLVIPTLFLVNLSVILLLATLIQILITSFITNFSISFVISEVLILTPRTIFFSASTTLFLLPPPLIISNRSVTCL